MCVNCKLTLKNNGIGSTALRYNRIHCRLRCNHLFVIYFINRQLQFQNIKQIWFLWEYYSYDAMPLYLGVVLHTFVPVLTTIRQKWRPLVKLFRNVWINGNKLHCVRIISLKIWGLQSHHVIPVKHQNIKQISIKNLPTTANAQFLPPRCDWPAASAKAMASVYLNNLCIIKACQHFK
jgi:hypothetical protein